MFSVAGGDSHFYEEYKSSSKSHTIDLFTIESTYEYIKVNNQTVQYGRLIENRQYAYASPKYINKIRI